MDVIEFIKIANRMCERANSDCSDCCFKGKTVFCVDDGFSDVPLKEFEKAVQVVEEWAKEHPVKTRETEFLKLFPNAQLEKDSYSPICPHALDETWTCRRTDCKKCRQDFWSQEV